jgi:hypothetical protein
MDDPPAVADEEDPDSWVGGQAGDRFPGRTGTQVVGFVGFQKLKAVLEFSGSKL